MSFEQPKIEKRPSPSSETRAEEAEEIPLRWRTNYGEEVIRPLDIKEREIFVDIGAGVGLATVVAAQKKSAEGIGIELNKPTVKLAKKLSKIIEFIPKHSQAAEYVAEIMESERGCSSEKNKNGNYLEFLQQKIKKLKEKEITPEEEKEMRSFIADWLVGKDISRFYQNLKNRIGDLDEALRKIPSPEGINFLQGNIVRLPLRDNSADKILCADVIHWIPEEKDRRSALKEMLRIAKDGSLIYVFSDPFWAKRRRGLIFKKTERTDAQEEIERVAKEQGIILEKKPAEGVPGRQFIYEVIKNAEGQKRSKAMPEKFEPQVEKPPEVQKN